MKENEIDFILWPSGVSAVRTRFDWDYSIRKMYQLAPALNCFRSEIVLLFLCSSVCSVQQSLARHGRHGANNIWRWRRRQHFSYFLLLFDPFYYFIELWSMLRVPADHDGDGDGARRTCRLLRLLCWLNAYHSAVVVVVAEKYLLIFHAHIGRVFWLKCRTSIESSAIFHITLQSACWLFRAARA